MFHRRYNLVLAALLGPTVLLLSVASALLEPYAGDLTRLGGYREADFGWNGYQKRFSPPLYELVATRAMKSPGHVDIMILGDSFSRDTKASWPNYLVNETGLTVNVYRHDRLSVEKLVKSDAFLADPPRVLIYQIVERNLAGLQRKSDRPCVTRNKTLPAAPLMARPLGVEPELQSRKARASFLNFPQSIDYLGKTAMRSIFGRDPTPTRRLALTREAPFSGSEKQQLLVYKGDLGKSAWTEATWRDIRCGLVRMQNRVQANGKTFFVAMVAPDKLSAYSDLLSDRQYSTLSRIDILAGDSGLHLPRIDIQLKQEISNGTVDVYRGNDTHWGSTGYELAAKGVLDYLIQAGVIEIAQRRPR